MHADTDEAPEDDNDEKEIIVVRPEGTVTECEEEVRVRL
jgi:hypothetical protein